MWVALVDGEDGPIASVVNFACHATVLNSANLMLTGEFIGAASRLVQEQSGAPCIYLNGACGDVNPAWIKQDFASVERVGRIVGGEALRVIGELQTLGCGQRAHNIRWDEFPELAVPGRIAEPRLAFVRRELDLEQRPFREDAEYAELIGEAEAAVDANAADSAARRSAMAQLSRYSSERWAATWARRTGETVYRTEIQALRLGEGFVLLALPGEFFADTGRKLRERSGIEDLLVVGYANDYIGYVVPADEYEKGGYEAGVTFFPPETEGMIVGASLDLLREVMSGD
jgi:hypothetical protein